MRFRSVVLLWFGLALSGCGDDVIATDEADASGSGSDGSSDGDSSSDSDSTGEMDASDSGTDTSDSGTDTTDETGETGDEPDPAEALFESGTIAEFDIQLSETSYAVLDGGAKVFVIGALSATVDGEQIYVPDIGVRLKGNYGSYLPLDEKAAFLLDFNRYVPDQTFLGLEKLAINNMVQDPSMQREVLGYRLFREGGAPAPRAAHAVVSVNGELYGLYTTVESADNEGLLDEWFDDHDGNLYEGAYGSDLFLELLDTFDLDNGEDVDFADLVELILVLDSVADPEQFVEVASEVIDLDLYLTTAATGMYLGDWDGYYWSRNNYYMYRRPSDMRWVWMPWGIDQTMASHLPVFEGDGRLTQMCNASLECRAMLADKYEEVVARVDALALADEAAAIGQQIYAAADADPRKPYDIDAVLGTIDANIWFLTNRGQEVLDGLVCVDPELIDGDNDGHNGCGEDCNDGDPDVYPGATEVCDYDDDNCDGQWDNAPMCPQCMITPLPDPDVGNAAFCFISRNWVEAEADCVQQGGHLISVHSQAMQDFLTSNAFGIQGGDWWIGLNDINSEGIFGWSDATPLDYTTWNGGEPNNAGDEDCVHLPIWAGGNWNDLPCGSQAFYICRLP
jgi:spore coat protein CotH